MEKDLPTNDPELKGVPKQAPFQVPEGYFDTLSQRIMARLPEEAAPRLAWWQQWRTYRVAVPAFLVLLVAGVLGWQSLQGPATDPDYLAEVSDEAMLAYLDEVLDPEDVLYYDLAYLDESQEIGTELWEGSIDEGVYEYLDEMTLEELESLDIEGLTLDL